MCGACLNGFKRIEEPCCGCCGRPFPVADVSHLTDTNSTGGATAQTASRVVGRPLCCVARTYAFTAARSFAIFDDVLSAAVVLLKYERVAPLGDSRRGLKKRSRNRAKTSRRTWWFQYPPRGSPAQARLQPGRDDRTPSGAAAASKAGKLPLDANPAASATAGAPRAASVGTVYVARTPLGKECELTTCACCW